MHVLLVNIEGIQGVLGKKNHTYCNGAALLLGNRRSCGGQEPSGRSRLLCSGECELQRTCSGSTEFPLLHPRNEGLRALCIGTDKCWWLCIEGSSVWNTPHVAIGTNSHRRRGRCTSILAERPNASLKSTTSNPPAGATCERCIPRSAARAARRSRRKRKSYYSKLGHEYRFFERSSTNKSKISNAN